MYPRLEEHEEHIAYLTRWCRARCENVPAAPVHSVGVIGAGLMGTAIAATNMLHGLEVTLVDSDPAALEAAPGRIAAELRQQGAGNADTLVRQRLRTGGSAETLAGCPLVVESIVEKLESKQSLYAQLESVLAPSAVITSNTSTIPIHRLAAGMRRPERFLGLHFFHPVRQRSLVEVIAGRQTTQEHTARAMSYARTIHKMPIAVSDGPGFVVNRLLMPYLNEGLLLLREGHSVTEVDGAATAFGMAMGPLRIMDEIGLDTTMSAGRVIWEAFPQRVAISPILVTLIKRKRLGRKTGAGFYAYDSSISWDDPGRVDPELDRLLEPWIEPAERQSAEQIARRLILAVLLEAGHLLDDRTVTDPEVIDLGMLFGLGFPRSRGGLLYWAQSEGLAQLLSEAEALFGRRLAPARSGNQAEDSLRCVPAALADRAREGSGFFAS